MSAIAGIIHFDGEPVDASAQESMSARLAHRGPDGRGAWSGQGVVLIHHMLRTTPQAMEETQPAVSADAVRVLVMDGRVDNIAALRSALPDRGARLRDGSDAELVLHAYESWGADCVARIEGDFALAVWDRAARELFCARDRMGHRPFVYCHLGRRFAFASELQALLALPWVSRAIDEGTLAEHVAADWHSRERTLWRDISRLPAANRMRVSASDARRDVYWRPGIGSDLPYREEGEFVEHYRALLEDSVARAGRSQRTVAIEVSGGLDSSAVLAVAEGLRRQGRLTAPGILAATMTFEHPAADEVAHARAVAAHLGVALHEVPGSVHPDAFYAERAADFGDFPGFPNAWLRFALLELASAHGCRVVLTGEGGDAWLDGTRGYYAEEIAARRWRSLAACFRADARAYGPWRPVKWVARHGVFALLAGRTARQRLLETLDDAFSAQVMESIERIAARHGIELRHPLDDYRLVELAFAMPERLRMRGDRGKYLHVRALEGRLPRGVLERRGKADFSGLMRAQVLGLRDEIGNALPARRRDWVSPGHVGRLYAALLREPHVGPCWPLWSLHGCDLALPRAPAPP